MSDYPLPTVRPRLKLPGFFGELLRTIVFVVVVTILFDMALPRSLVDGRSMQPTFEDADRLIISRLHYLLSLPQRGDVIVFNSLNTTRESDVMLVKRVIAVPGDTIEIIERRVHVNGVELNEPYIAEACSDFNCLNTSRQLGAGEYFVMGDNRNHSHDSPDFGPVPLNHIIGRVMFRYWPPQRVSLITTPNYQIPDASDGQNQPE